MHAGHGGYDDADSTARRGCRAVQRARADYNHQCPLLCLLLPVLHITEGAPPTGKVACVTLRLITSGRVFGSNDLVINLSVLQQAEIVHSTQIQQSGLEASETCPLIRCRSIQRMFSWHKPLLEDDPKEHSLCIAAWHLSVNNQFLFGHNRCDSCNNADTAYRHAADTHAGALPFLILAKQMPYAYPPHKTC